MPRIFAPPHDQRERPRRVVQQPAELAQFAVQQQSAEGPFHQAADGGGRGVGAVGRAERVVHVDVAEGGQLGGECRVVRFLARVEAEVLAQENAAVGEGCGGVPGGRPDAVRGELDGPAEDGGKGLGHRPQAERRVGLAPQAAAVGQQDDAGARGAEGVDGGRRLPQTGRVEHVLAGHRHVEVDPDDDPAAAEHERAVVEGGLEVGGRHHAAGRPVTGNAATSRREMFGETGLRPGMAYAAGRRRSVGRLPAEA